MKHPNTRGVVIGRFMPPHNGHRYLIDFARSFADSVTVFLCSTKADPIPGRVRLSWMRELFPRTRIVHITEELPEASRDNPDSPRIWAGALRAYLPDGADYLFASEDYGWSLAEHLGAVFVPVDPERSEVGVSASAIRHSPLAHWDYIPSVVRPYFVRIAAVAAGAESTAVARNLAAAFDTVWLAPYTERYRRRAQSAPENNHPRFLDAAQLSRLEAAQAEALLRRSNRVAFVPFDPFDPAGTAGPAAPAVPFPPARPAALAVRRVPDRLLVFGDLSGGEDPAARPRARGGLPLPAEHILRLDSADPLPVDSIASFLLAE